MKAKLVSWSVAVLLMAAVARADEKASPVEAGKLIVEKTKCSICHQIDGKGGKLGKPMNQLAGDSSDEKLTAELTDPKTAIGPNTKMPSYKGKLSDEEIKNVIAYLKSLKK